jgi:hypothetical protein
MSVPIELHIALLSDTTIGRMNVSSSVIDVELEHDESGLPFVPGKTLHGLLRESWLSMAEALGDNALNQAARRMLGESGTTRGVEAALRVDNAVLPKDIRQWAYYAVNRSEYPLEPELVLRSLTAIRRQTAVSHRSGAPDPATLRNTRVLLRGLTLAAPLTWYVDDLQIEQGGLSRCLARCVLATRHVGVGRNRGRGFVRMTLSSGKPNTDSWLETLQWADIGTGESS